jgi:hypothetical protein
VTLRTDAGNAKIKRFFNSNKDIESYDYSSWDPVDDGDLKFDDQTSNFISSYVTKEGEYFVVHGVVENANFVGNGRLIF